MTDKDNGEDELHRAGKYLGEIIGIRVRGGQDLTALEIHGEDGMAAVEIADEEFVDGLTEAAAEVDLRL